MKKVLLFVSFVLCVGVLNRVNAQCNGAAVTVTNFVVLAPGNVVNYSFDWTFVLGNASIQVVDTCNGVFEHAETCIPKLKDSASGSHHVEGSFVTTCTSGTLDVMVLIWTSNSCGGNNCTAVKRSITRSPLPADLISFVAMRNHTSVILKWQTATEKNNSGFAVERYTGSDWQQVAWVPTQAPGGNSTEILNYNYTDANNSRTVSQYRLRQVNLDGQIRYSQIRLVNSDAEADKVIVYPNPSPNGSVSISFGQSSSARNISIIDINGQLVKQMNNVMDNNIRVDNLLPGIYNVRIITVETGEQAVQKFVVNKN